MKATFNCIHPAIEGRADSDLKYERTR